MFGPFLRVDRASGAKTGSTTASAEEQLHKPGALLEARSGIHPVASNDATMKTPKIIQVSLAASSLAVALFLAAPGTAEAQEKGAQKLIQLKPIKTTHDIEALQAGDMVVMSCPKCKTITATYVETTKGHVKEEKTKTEHLCPGCETKIETKGSGKSAHEQVTHVCEKCGSKDVTCCVMKKGTAPTKGMEETK